MNSVIDELSQAQQEIYLIVKAFYSKSDASVNLKVLERQMSQFSRSDDAWETCMFLLRKDYLPEDAVYSFAAQTLKEKLRFDFASLDHQNDEILAGLWNGLTELINISPSRPPNVNRFLCNAMAVFIMQISKNFKKLQEVISRMIPGVYDPSKIHQYISVVRILQELPNVAIREDIVIDPKYQSSFLKNLKEDAEWVIQFLNSMVQHIIIQTGERRATQDILKTFAEWLNFGISKELLARIPSEYKNLLHLIFDQITKDDNFQTAADCFQEIVHYCRQEDTVKMEDLSKLIFTEIQKIKPRARQAVKNQDLAEVDILSPIFLELAGANLSTVCQTKQNPEIQDLMELLCSFFAVQDIEIEFHCYLWMDIIDELLHQNEPDMIEYYSGCLLNILSSCVEKVKVSPSNMGELNSKPYSDKLFNDLAQTRKRVRKLAFRIGQALGPLKPFTMLANRIEEAVKLIESQQEQALLEIESCIYLTTHVLDGHDDIPDSAKGLMKLIPQLPLNLVQIRRSVLDLIGSISRYFNSLAGDDDILTVLKVLIQSFSVPLVLQHAGDVFKDFIIYNHMLIGKQIPELVDNFATVLSQIPQDRFSQGVISGYVLLAFKQKQIDAGQIINKGYVAPIEQNIHDLLTKSQNLYQVRFKMQAQLINLSAIFQAVHTYQPKDQQQKIGTDVLFRRLWDLLKNLMHHYSNVQNIIEALSKSVKFVFRLCTNSMLDILSDYSQMLVKNYAIHKYSCYIYGAQFLISIYGKQNLRNEQNTKILEELFNSMVQHTLPMLENRQIMEENPLITQDYFGLLTRTIRYSPDILIKSPHFNFIIENAKGAIGVESFTIAKILYSFFEQFFLLSVPYQDSQGARAYHSPGSPFARQNFTNLTKSRKSRFGNTNALLSNEAKQFCYEQGVSNMSDVVSSMIACFIEAPTQTVVSYLVDSMIAVARVNWEEFLKQIDIHIKKVPTYMLSPSEIEDFAMNLNLASLTEEIISKLHHLAYRCKKGRLRN